MEIRCINDRARTVRKTFPDFILFDPGEVFQAFLALLLK
jgi:hypothetical protein